MHDILKSPAMGVCALTAALLAVPLAFAETNDSQVVEAVEKISGRDIDRELVAAWQSEEMKEADGVPMEQLSFPIDHFEDGTVRAQFSARWALVPNDEDAFIRAKGICIELYDESGSVVGMYLAENCIFDRTTRVGYCEGPVRIEYKAPERNIRLDGVNMQWNLATRNAKILSEPKLVMSDIMGNLGKAFRLK